MFDFAIWMIGGATAIFIISIILALTEQEKLCYILYQYLFGDQFVLFVLLMQYLKLFYLYKGVEKMSEMLHQFNILIVGMIGLAIGYGLAQHFKMTDDDE